MAIAPPQKHLTDLYEWHKMGDAGIFSPDSRLELINGEILEMAPIGCNHAGHINRINQLLTLLTANKAITSVQNPLQLGDLSEPQPDLMLLKPDKDFYCSHHPNADDVLLLVEVADSSLNFDRNQKLRLYALHGIPEYWLLNLTDNCLEVYRQPRHELYAEKSTLYRGDTVQLVQFPDIMLPIKAII